MDDLIYDSYSIFFQILQHVAPDYVGESEFLLVGYAFSCVFFIMVLGCIFQIVTALSRAIVSWFSKGC